MRSLTARKPAASHQKPLFQISKISIFSIITLISISSIGLFWYWNPSLATKYVTKLISQSPSSLSSYIHSQFPKKNQIDQDDDLSSPSTQKIIAVGDFHGDYANTLQTLVMAGIANQEGNWVAGKTIFVQTGDIVDRGDDTIQLYEMMIRLKKQASEVGGLVVPLLGNHEVMNMQHDFRYVTQGDVDSFGGWKQRNLAWSKDGWIGKYLRGLGVAALVNETVFFHGGANVKWAKETVSGLNQASKIALETLSPQKLQNVGLFGGDGPLWYRGYAEDDEKVVCPLLDRALKYLNATRMVVGHTPQLSGKVLRRCQGKVYVIDVGISRVYGGHSAALEIIGDTVTGLYPRNIRIKY